MHTTVPEDRARAGRLGASDVRALVLSGVVVLDTLGVLGQVGGQAIVWLALLGVLFVLPYAMLVAELGSSFPGEGGPYHWVRLAFGRPAAALCAVLYWAANPIWLGGTLAIVSVSVFESFFTDLGSARYVAAGAFVWATVAGTLVDLRRARWIPVTGAAVRVGLLGFLTVSVVVYGIANGLHGIALRDLEPTGSGLVVAVPLLVFGLLGLELPSALGRELRNPARDLPRGVRAGSIAAVVLYAAPLGAMLLVLPLGARAGVGGSIDAIRAVFTVYGGHVDVQGVPHLSGMGSVLGEIAALGFIYALLTGGATWLIGSNRVLAAAAADGALPRVLAGRARASGAPVLVGLLGGAGATAVLVLSYALADGRLARYLAAMVGLAVSTVLLGSLLVFPSLIRLRLTCPRQERPFAVPGGVAGAWACSILTTSIAAFAAVELIYPGLGLARPDSMLPASFAGLRTRYEQAVALPLAGVLALALLGWLIARRQRSPVSRA
jgi:amino acid transporter